MREHLRDAAHYLEAEERLVRMGPGVWASGVTFVLIIWLSLGFSLVYTAGVEAGIAVGSAGSYSVEVVESPGPSAGSYSVEDPRWMEVSIITPTHLVATLIAFLAGARAWRLLTRRGGGL